MNCNLWLKQKQSSWYRSGHSEGSQVGWENYTITLISMQTERCISDWERKYGQGEAKSEITLDKGMNQSRDTQHSNRPIRWHPRFEWAQWQHEITGLKQSINGWQEQLWANCITIPPNGQVIKSQARGGPPCSAGQMASTQ